MRDFRRWLVRRVAIAAYHPLRLLVTVVLTVMEWAGW